MCWLPNWSKDIVVQLRKDCRRQKVNLDLDLLGALFLAIGTTEFKGKGECTHVSDLRNTFVDDLNDPL